MSRDSADRSGLRQRCIRWAVLIVVLLLALHFFQPSQTGLWLHVFYNSLHVPVFGIIAVAVFMITSAKIEWQLRQRLIVTAVSVLVISTLSEAAQIPGPRDASMEDLIANLLGATSFLLLALAVSSDRQVGRRISRVCGLAGSALLLVALSDLAFTSAACLEQRLCVPTLVDFDSYLGERFILAQHATIESVPSGTDGNGRARIRLGDGAWPGVIFHDIWPDWSPYSTLVLELQGIGEEPLEINIRVHDEAHRQGSQPHSDRFNMRLTLGTTPQTVRIPLENIGNAPKTRKMDLTRIDGIVIFASRDAAGRQFWLSEIRLE